MARYALGRLKQKDDHRDRKMKFVRRKFSPTVDLTPEAGPFMDQGSLGSCGLCTMAQLIIFDQILQGLSVVIPSRLFMYYCCRVLMGQIANDPTMINQDTGVDNRTLFKSVAASGFCPETDWAYDIAKYTQKPEDKAFADALTQLITNYAAVDVNLSSMKACLDSTGRPFMFGFKVYPSMMKDEVAVSGIVPMPGSDETPEGGHDVAIYGYSDVERPGIEPGKIWPARTIRFGNHWSKDDGTPWGDASYGYAPYEFAEDPNQVEDLWTLYGIPDPTLCSVEIPDEATV